MQTATTISAVREAVAQARQQGQRIGCVPTMGALHAGHLSLIEQARQVCDFVVTTIFVNPTQFAPHEDFNQYPRPLAADLKLCQTAGADLVFHPEVATIYGEKPQVRVTVGELGSLWEGASRPGHFDGVATVVTKLFHIVLPDVAFFGAKDYQQQAILKAMCRDLDFPLEIITCPTVRADDGLALSSRNAYLSAEERQTALCLNHTLTLTQELLLAQELTLPEIQQQMQQVLQNQPGLELDYAVIADPVTLQALENIQPEMVLLVAARVGKTRLIDNLEVRLPLS